MVAGVVITACGGSETSVGSIVIQSDRDGDAEIFVLDQDGGAPLQLTDNDVFDGNPDWSPDGSRLVFTSGNRDGGLEIYMMNADGSGIVQLTDDDVDNGAADWSPDGTRIVFDGFDAEGVLQVYTMAVDEPGTPATQLTKRRCERQASVVTGWRAHRVPLPAGRHSSRGRPSCRTGDLCHGG